MPCSEPMHTDIKTTATSKAEGRLMMSGTMRRKRNRQVRKTIAKISK